MERYTESLLLWKANHFITQEKVDEVYYIRLARMTRIIKKLEEAGEDVSKYLPLTMSYEMADAINNYVYGTKEVDPHPTPPPPAPILMRRNACISVRDSLLLSLSEYTMEVKAFQNVFGYASAPGADRRKHAILAWAKRHPPKKV